MTALLPPVTGTVILFLAGVNAAVRTVNPQEAALKITAAGFGGMMIGDGTGISGKLLLNGGSRSAICIFP